MGIEWINIETIIDEPLFPKELRTFIKSYTNGNKEKTYLGEIF